MNDSERRCSEHRTSTASPPMNEQEEEIVLKLHLELGKCRAYLEERNALVNDLQVTCNELEEKLNYCQGVKKENDSLRTQLSQIQQFLGNMQRDRGLVRHEAVLEEIVEERVPQQRALSFEEHIKKIRTERQRDLEVAERKYDELERDIVGMLDGLDQMKELVHENNELKNAMAKVERKASKETDLESPNHVERKEAVRRLRDALQQCRTQLAKKDQELDQMKFSLSVCQDQRESFRTPRAVAFPPEDDELEGDWRARVQQMSEELRKVEAENESLRKGTRQLELHAQSALQEKANCIATYIRALCEYEEEVIRLRLEREKTHERVKQLESSLNTVRVKNHREIEIAKKKLVELETTIYQLRLNETQRNCAICLVSYDVLIKKLPCQHKFHTNCINEWLKDHSTCPLCRSQLESSTESL